MEEKQNNNAVKGDNNPLIYITLILLGAALISVAGYYVPILFAGILFLAPFALKLDMETKKPIASIGLVVIAAIYMYFVDINYSLYYVLAVSLGASTALSYIVWRYFGVKTFETGITYTLLVSATFGVSAALVVFLINGRRPFSLEMVNALESWVLNNDSNIVNETLAMLTTTIYNMEDSSILDFNAALNTLNQVMDMSKAEQLKIFIEYFSDSINTYAMYGIVLFPAIASGITYWIGSCKFYKNEPARKDEKTLKPKPYSIFSVPRRVFGISVLLMIASFLIQASYSEDMWVYAAVMMQSFVFVLLYMQGFAVLDYFLKRTKAFRITWLRVIAIGLITVLSFGFITSFIGIVDLFINIRLVYTRAKEIKEKMNRINKDRQDRQDNSQDKQDRQ